MTPAAQQQIGGGPVPPLVMPSLRVVGVDPGCYGALALMVGGKLFNVWDMPFHKVRRGDSDKAEVEGYALGTLIQSLEPHVVVVERVGGVTGQGAAVSFNFGRAAGAPEYAAMALRIRVETVAPIRWKRSLGVTSDKGSSRAKAIELFPEHGERFERVKDDGRAEAALIAHWFTVTNGAFARPEHLAMTIRK